MVWKEAPLPDELAISKHVHTHTHTHASAVEFFLCLSVSKFKSSREIKMKLNTYPLNNNKTEKDFQELKNQNFKDLACGEKW